ncbi:hypothetical protein M8I35_04155 [Micromonospora sp. MSM11]|nr:hypothetical protein [Micromonospora sp. MSM11]MCL7456375.1 hypothetical protein [Micromonospora sp. MSM11]
MGEVVEAGSEVGGGGHFVVGAGAGAGAGDGGCGDLGEVKFGFSALLLVTLLWLTACQTARRPSESVQRCARGLTVDGYAQTQPYEDRTWLEVGFIGPASTSGAEKVKLDPAGKLSLALVPQRPSGPYVVIAEGEVRLAADTCSISVEKLKQGLEPPGHLGISPEQSAAVAGGESELIILMIGPETI